MKKKILLVVLVGMLFAGVVSAASIWGTYKGNQIIRITSNGTPLRSSDVPAISYNGRTMIPINMLGQIGLSYTWDGKNQTVEVATNSNTTTSVDALKRDAIMKANLFKYLEDLGEGLMDTKRSYDLAMMSKMIGPSTQSTTAYNSLSISINNYNVFINRQDVLTYSSSDASINQILSSYYDTIDKLKEIDIFVNSASATDKNTPLKYSILAESATNLANAGIKSSGTGFSKYIYEASK